MVNGVLEQWLDGKGYGFIRAENGVRVWCHIRSFNHLSRPPVEGDEVSFLISNTPRGNVAVDIEIAGLPFGRSDRYTAFDLSAASLAALVYLLLPAAVLYGILPFAVIPGAAATGLVTAFCYYRDREIAAGRAATTRRIAEPTLYFWELLGGWPAGIICRRLLRHKSRKTDFRLVAACCMILNLAAVLLWSEPYGRPVRTMLASHLRLLFS